MSDNNPNIDRIRAAADQGDAEAKAELEKMLAAEPDENGNDGEDGRRRKSSAAVPNQGTPTRVTVWGTCITRETESKRTARKRSGGT